METFYRKLVDEHFIAFQLLSESALLFRHYEQSHNSKIKRLPDENHPSYSIIKANNKQAKDRAVVNAEIATRIELFLKPSETSSSLQ